MPRIRTIKPEFWEDAKVGRWSPHARLLFLGGLNFADDYGVLRGDPAFLRSRIFPYDDVSLPDVETMIGQCIESGAMDAFDADGERWLYYTHWTKHQQVNRPSAVRNPAPPRQETRHAGALTEGSLRAHGGLTESSVIRSDPHAHARFLDQDQDPDQDHTPPTPPRVGLSTEKSTGKSGKTRSAGVHRTRGGPIKVEPDSPFYAPLMRVLDALAGREDVDDAVRDDAVYLAAEMRGFVAQMRKGRGAQWYAALGFDDEPGRSAA